MKFYDKPPAVLIKEGDILELDKHLQPGAIIFLPEDAIIVNMDNYTPPNK